MDAAPQRWRRAVRVAAITAVGAGVTASLQISNALGLTLLFNMATPEAALGFAPAVKFLCVGAICQVLGMALASAMVDSPIPHLALFAALSMASSYFIFADSRLGRIWIWAQVPALTAFYLVLFDPNGFMWTDAQAFGGVAVAVLILYVANTVLWWRSPHEVLRESLADTLDRLRRRLQLVLEVWLNGGDVRGEDQPVASKLGYHLTLLGPSNQEGGVDSAADLLSTVMLAERIHKEIDRIADLVTESAGIMLDGDMQAVVRDAGAEVDAVLGEYASRVRGSDWAAGGVRRPPPNPTEKPRSGVPAPRVRRSLAELAAGGDGGAAGAPVPTCALIDRLHAICALVDSHFAQILFATIDSHPQLHATPIEPETARSHRFRLRRRPNRFLMRYATRHTIAMVLAFVCGLATNNAAMHAALWLLMIGGPPSHGATARKFTIRAAGAAAALLLVAVVTVAIAPNGTSLFSYMIGIFLGCLLMAYIGEGGGLLSFLSIGGTAFVIAFSGPGPRNDVFASIWTIWGISFGMLIRAAVSVLWRERPSRTLTEEFQAPLEALLALLGAADNGSRDAAEVESAEMALLGGVREMLAVATDAQLQGHSSGIDASNLVGALDTLCRIGFIIGNRALRIDASSYCASDQPIEELLRARFADWLKSLRIQEREGVPSRAPLRQMLIECAAPELAVWTARDEQERRLIALVRELEEQLKTISVVLG